MNYFLTLPSNSTYPNNTQANFTTILNPPIIFNDIDKYEVALTEFSCSDLIKVKIAEVEIPDPIDNNLVIKVEIFINNNVSIETFVKQYLKSFEIKFLEIFKDKNRVSAFMSTNYIPIFNYSENNLKLEYNNQKAFKISGLLCDILNNSNLITSNAIFKPEIQNIFNIIQYICIYTDFIEDQYFGDSCSKILQLINMQTDSRGVHSFENPHYIPINKNRLCTINISIRDMQGELIKFLDIFSISLLKLHIRKIKKNE